jgi:WhiB family transcriptional regulator, redox-sensing transcriptional regulator
MAAVLAPAVSRRGSANWQQQAACRGADTRIFYHPDNERGPSRRRRDMQAKQICRGCAVITECLSRALATREPYGVWGGLSPEERGALLTSQPA